MLKWLIAFMEAASVASPAAEAPASSLAALPLPLKGLLVTLMGLLGVFLVLTLLFATIRLMQKLDTKESK